MSVSDLLLRVECYVALRSAIGYTVRYEEKLLKDDEGDKQSRYAESLAGVA